MLRFIAEGIKEYEFRTWKTNYRGEFLVHAGKEKNLENIAKQYFYDTVSIGNNVLDIIVMKRYSTTLKYDENYSKRRNNKNNCSMFSLGKTHKGTHRKRLTEKFNTKRMALLDNIVEKCLDNNPEERYQNIKELKMIIALNM